MPTPQSDRSPSLSSVHPGRGNQRFVDRITKAVERCRPIPTANLTQLAGPDALVETFKKGLALPPPEPGRELTPVFFFDEFDASLNDAPLGWLRWFLGPMQDGKLLANGQELKIGKAIFMFAGGTAESLDEFNRRAQLDLGVYRARKVPDFVSRLRGAIEIGGINGLGNARVVPRAVVLRRLLVTRSDRLTDDQIRQLLSNGHFVHGVRSMEALLDAQRTESGGLDLPDAFRQQHFSRGVLDGQLVGISAGLNEPASQAIFSALTTQLLRNGASLAYGGDFIPHGTLHQVVEAARLAPPELGVDTTKPRPKRVYNYLGFPASLKAQSEVEPGGEKPAVEFIKLQTLSPSELEELGAPSDRWFAALPIAEGDAYDPRRHVAWALSLFRMRVRIVQDLSALIVLGGKDDGRSWGRFAGIAEEVTIAIALRKPVYVLGGASGAARATGQLLGLDATTPDLRRCLAPAVQAELAHALKPYAHCFEIPGEPKSPIDLAEIREFLYHRGVTTSTWPWNGLNLPENRQLFACPVADGNPHVDRAVELIVKGLSRVDWKT
jgi:SLOG cluster2